MEKKTETKQENFFLNSDVPNTLQKYTEKQGNDVYLVLEKIKELQPIIVYQLAKKLPFSRSKVYYILRDLEFAGLIRTKVVLGKTNRSERWVYLNNGGYVS